jgi:hypothetical protein
MNHGTTQEKDFKDPPQQAEIPPCVDSGIIDGMSELSSDQIDSSCLPQLWLLQRSLCVYTVRIVT